MVFLVDRQYNFRMVSHFHTTSPNPYLPEGTNLSKVIIANFFDGELVVDSPWRKESLAPIFLIFDALIVNTSNVIGEPFNLRLKTAHDYIARRFLPARSLPGKEEKLPPIDVYMKEMFHVWDAKELMPKLVEQRKLMHENDGLIFTVDECPYYPGTCEQIWKWKPVDQNSIDFVLRATMVD